jgi:indole-3-glycerol phosphate synthase
VTYLDQILADHRETAGADERDLHGLVAEAVSQPPCRGFADALRADGLSVIAEIKRRSPSKGDLAPGLDPAAVARGYATGGARCLSVLTDARWFGAETEDLRAARAAVDLPVLRKDFTVDARDVCDARIMGADAVLLIVAALDDEELQHFLQLARHIGLDALVEVHDAEEVERAVASGAEVIGVNQRDLVTFAVDPERAAALRPLIPGDVVSVAESGIGGPEDARRLADAGYDAILVGESLVRASDRAAAVRALCHP